MLHALMMASLSGHADIAKLLLDACAELDTKNADGLTARELALANSNGETLGLRKC